jgi:hypothetical protein
MKKVMLMFSGLLSFSTQAQNLVPNPSFEDTVSCPFYYNQMNRAVGWSAYRDSPDYFNSCNNTWVSVPTNDVGFQYARTGSAYAGFLSYTGTINREWLGCQLTQQLVVGQKYLLSFWVSMAFKYNASGFHINSATNKIGLRLSTVVYPVNNSLPLNGYDHLHTDSVITDTSNWVNISGSFTADSAYNYIVIGNFFSDSAITRISLDTVSGQNPYAYYYVEDVSVMLDTTTGIIPTTESLDLIKVFPNPAINWIEVVGKNLKSISFTDALGREYLYCLISNSFHNRIDISNLSRGIYFLKITNASKSYLQKIILN